MITDYYFVDINLFEQKLFRYWVIVIRNSNMHPVLTPTNAAGYSLRCYSIKKTLLFACYAFTVLLI